MTTRRWSTRLAARAVAARSGMTLIEIMAAILVLSIGLVGVLAAIPFGGFRMAQMQEADYAAALGRNAARAMRTNGWADPENWWYEKNMGQVAYFDPNAIYQDGNINLSRPFFVDPTSFSNGVRAPQYNYLNSDVLYFTSIYPTLNDTWVSKDRIDSTFYLQDDLAYGFEGDEDSSEFRPSFTSDEIAGDDDAAKPFSGRYSWFASVYPKESSDAFNDCSPSDVTAADFDVVVCKDRIAGDEKAFDATVDGSGYQGGAVTINLESVCGNVNDITDNDLSRIVEQFATTRYLMLSGPSDETINSSSQRNFSRWYKIANYSVSATDDDGYPTELRVTLIGQNTPVNWKNGGSVSAIFFPGVIGVFSGSANFERD